MRRLTGVCLLVAGLVSLVAGPTGAQPPQVSGVVGPLTTRGNQIIDGQGNPVTLRGVNREWIDQYDTFGSAVHLDEAYVSMVQRTGASIIRLALGEQFWNNRECAYDKNYAGHVDQLVNWITARGMVALLDLHHNTLVPCGQQGMQKMATTGPGLAGLGSVEFWKSVATRYRGNPLVAFDLYNEPQNLTWSQWRDGGLITNSVPPFRAAGMQQLYDAIRGTGASNLIVVSGNSWASVLPPASWQLRGINIAYGLHFYTCPDYSAQGCATEPKTVADPSTRLAAWNAFAAAKPLLITEFGWPWDDTGSWDAAVIQWAETHASGWIAYQMTPFAPKSNDPFGFLSSWTSLAPTPRGGAILRGLAAPLHSTG